MSIKHLFTFTGAVCAAVAFAAPPAELLIQSPVVTPGAPQQVQAPANVSIAKDNNANVVTAATMQDAVNQAVTMSEDVTIVKCKSGSGFVAMGSASYSKYANRNASLIGQRQAFIKAMTIAKKNLAAFLEGMDVEDQQKMIDEITQIDQMNNANGSEMLAKEINLRTTKGAVSALLRGCTIFKFSEENQTVKVWIYTSPVTRSGNVELNSNVTMVAPSEFDAAFKKFYGQLKSGFCPPEGSRVFLISNPDGSVLPFFVGYGSQIIRKVNSTNATLNAKSFEKAKNDAKLFAAASLCRALTGDKASWSGKTTEITAKGAKSPGYDKAVAELKDDPVNKDNILNDAAADAAEAFLNVSKSTDIYSSAVKGRLPAGCQQFTWTDSNGDWAYACVVFNPQMTAKVNAEKNTVVRASGAKPNNAPVQNKNQEIKPLAGEGELL